MERLKSYSQGFRIELDGLDDIKEVLNTIAPKHARNLMRSTVHSIAGEISKKAKSIVVRDTGRLRKAIKTRRRRSDPDAPVSEVYIQSGRGTNPDAFYWRFVEHGTKDQGAQPFIRPATDEVKANLNEIVRDQFGKKLAAMLKRQAKKRF